MLDEKDSAERSIARVKNNRDGNIRLMISGVILAVFWGAVLYNYWPALVPAGLRLLNTARTVGAATMESSDFEVHNNSDASDSQIQTMVNTFQKQYQAISKYTKTKPKSKLQLLVVNGHGPALVDGEQIVINYDKGLVDTELVPLYLAVLTQNIPINPSGGLIPAGGEALHVVEAAGLGNPLIRQPLDSWAALIRQSKAYVPLDEAWQATMPNSDEGYYLLMRGMLESGSFMGWFSAKYGLDAAQRVARGEDIQAASGKTLGANEKEWLQGLDHQKTRPKACDTVIPEDSLFRLLCKKLPAAQN